jgi:hypothetical protein
LRSATVGTTYTQQIVDLQAKESSQTAASLVYALVPTVVSGVSVLPSAGMTIDSQGRITWNPTVADRHAWN